MIRLDPWIMTATTTSATLNSATVTDYAQHKNAVKIEYTPQGKRKPRAEWITPREACAIWRGILPDVPANIKYTDCGGSGMMKRANYAGESAREYIARAVEYFESIGFSPVVDTVTEPKTEEVAESLDDSSAEYLAYFG